MPAVANSRRRANAKKPASGTRLQARLFGALAQRPFESFAAAVFAALMTGVVLNAVAFQNARHPSPLFATPISVSPSITAPADVPKPVPRPAPISAAPAVDAEPPAATKAPDPIGQMLRTPPSSPAGAAPARRPKNSSASETGRHTAN